MSPQHQQEVMQLVGSVSDLSDVWETLGFQPTQKTSSLTTAYSRSKAEEKTTEGSEIDEVASNSTDDSAEEHRRLWTKHVFADISCDGKFLVLASQKDILILTAKWQNERLVFTKLWDGMLSDASETSNEQLTFCLALPLRSKRSSSDGLPDWTCIVYGFKSGYVAFHTEAGYSVHRQQFEVSAVVKIKLRSSPASSASGDFMEHQQELVVLYENGVVVIINGTDLYTSLQSFKQNAATAVSRGSTEDDQVELQYIPHEKYQCSGKKSVLDVISLGSARISAFDQLLNASTLGGKDATVKGHQLTFRRFIVVGSRPLCGSYYIIEGESSLALGQVAKDVASKVTTALTTRITATANRFGLSGFLGRNLPSAITAMKDAEKRFKTMPKSPTSVDARYSFYDARRIATAIAVSASGRSAALTDNFGRVLLLDCASGLVVRMWKGYRSAEVAWTTLVDNRAKSPSSSPKVSVECIIVYAPRRHLLEVWTATSGKRLVAVRVEQGLRLLPLGADLLPFPAAGDSGRVNQCFFLDLTGRLYTLNIPFYLTEEEAEATDSHNAQLLQEVKEWLVYPEARRRASPAGNRGGSNRTKDLKELIGQMTNTESKNQAVQMIVASQSDERMTTGHLQEVIQMEIRNLKEDEKSSPVVRSWKDLSSILSFYSTLQHNLTNPPSKEEDDDTMSMVVSSALSESDVSALLPLVSAVSAASNTSSTLLDLNLDWRTFFSMLEVVRVEQASIEDFGEKETVDGVNMKESVVFRLNEGEKANGDEEKKMLLDFGVLLFAPYFQKKIGFREMVELVERLQRKEVIGLLLNVWLERNNDVDGCSTEGIARLDRLMHELLRNLEPEDLQEYRSVLENSTVIPAALTACLAFLSTGFHRTRATDEEEWEQICKEKLEWNRLSNRLETLLSLQVFLVKFLTPGKSFTAAAPVSVQDFQHRGTSAAAEYLASWIAKGFVDIPPAAIMTAFHTSSEVEIRFSSTEEEEKDDRPLKFLTIPEISMDNKEVTEALQVLKAVFPKSLTADVLLANCCLELVVLWNKNPEDTTLLNLALLYLKDVVRSQVTHGVGLMIWRTFLAERASAIAALMEKVGKAPKERLFARDVHMSDTAVGTFLDLTHQYLNLVADADYNRQEKPIFETEDLWYNEATAVSGKKSVVELAVAQAASNAPLVRHHVILLTILHAVMRFGLKSVKPLSLFDFKAREAFFQDFTLHPVLSILDIDQATIRARHQFLGKVVAAIVKHAAEHCEHPNVTWMERIEEVAAYWEVAGDEVRTLYVVELYSNGLDELGAEAYKTITDKQPLLCRLLTLAGQRLAALTSNVQSQTSFARNFSTMSPTLGAWVRSMDANALASQEIDWEQCYLLVRNISHDLNKNTAQYKLCGEVIEWIQSYVLTR